MTEANRNAEPVSWPVIVNSKLQKSELCKILKTRHKVKGILLVLTL